MAVSKALLPVSGTALGAYVSLTGVWTNEATAERDVATRETAMGRRFAIDNHFYSWTDYASHKPIMICGPPHRKRMNSGRCGCGSPRPRRRQRDRQAW